jgi:hypothetical protein
MHHKFSASPLTRAPAVGGCGILPATGKAQPNMAPGSDANYPARDFPAFGGYDAVAQVDQTGCRGLDVWLAPRADLS